MKNKHRLNILPPLIAAMFIMSMFSGLVAAQTPAEQNEKQYRVYKDKYDNTRKKFEDAKGLFEKANARLKDAKDAKSKDELVLRTRAYIEGAIDQAIAHLEVLKSRAELPENNGVLPFDATKNIEAHIAQLEQLRTKVQQATTIQELRDSHKELKDIWARIILETRYYFELILDNRIDKFITRADNVSARIDAAIERAKSKGKDVTELQKDADRYKALVNDAKASQKQTSGLFETHNGFASDGTVTDTKAAAEFLKQADKSQRETIQKLKLASKQLINFVRDFRKISGGKVNVSGNGDLEANDGNTEVTATATSTPAVTATSTPEVTVTATSTVTLTATPTTTLTAASGN